MGVRVDEARNNGAATEIELLRAAGRETENVAVRADREDAVPGDGNRLRDRLGGVDRDDVAVMENDFGLLARYRCPGTAS